MKLLKYSPIFFVAFIFSCNSLYKSINIRSVDEIKISRYENYYEGEPYGEIYVKDKEDIDKIIRYLKMLPAKGEINKGFHNFSNSKISLEFISDNDSKIIHIIDGRLEIEKYMFYSRLYYCEQKLVILVNSF